MIRLLVAKVELVIGGFVTGLTIGLGVVGLRPSGGMFERTGFQPTDLLIPAAVACAVVGYAWMWRLAGADPEAGPSSWRYRQD
jgi:hypothetical protein